MANDAFEQQIVDLVRKMPDAAIIALVKDRLGTVLGTAAPAVAAAAAAAPAAATKRRGRPARAAAPAPAAAPAAPAAPAAKRGAAPAKRKPGRPKKTAALSAERQEVLNSVERIVKSGNGVSASDVARQAGIPQTRAAAALKELKLAKRIFQGGDRRFARYAGDAKTAETASVNARKTASGPAAAAAPAPAPKKAAAPRKRAAKNAAAAAPAAK
jgi:Replication protein A C terminal